MAWQQHRQTMLLLLLLYVAAGSAAPEQQQKQQKQECWPLETVILARSGQRVAGGGVWGQLHDGRGQPIPGGRNGAALYSTNPDFPSIQEVGGSVFMVNHFEAPQPNTAYVSLLDQDAATGRLTMRRTAPVDASSVQGLWFMCRGEKTPWGTHLAGEEYPPDCREFEELFLPCTNTSSWCGWTSNGSWYSGAVLQFARYFGFTTEPAAIARRDPAALSTGGNLDAFKRKFSCYAYGGSPEISVTSASGSTRVVKWRTLGRISHETAVVMPDNKTVYSTDDGSSGVLLKFVADKPGDLSAGTLYAAKLQHQSPEAFDISWVRLAHGTQAGIEALAVNPGTRFSQLFDAAPVQAADGRCPQGFGPANTPGPLYKTSVRGKPAYVECLRVKPGQEVVAAFLETRRVAALRGATTEFEKLEGFTVDPASHRAYAAISNVGKGMLAGDPQDGLGPDHIRMPPNPCGAVLELRLDPGSWSATHAKVLVAGRPSKAAAAGGKKQCDEDGIAGPDNLAVVAGNLLIAEDTGLHANNVLWALNLHTGTLSRILSVPPGAEVSGPSLSWAGGRAFITFVAQHPYDSEGEGDPGPRDADEEEAMRGYVGYLGPLPAEAVGSRSGLDFAAGALVSAARGGDRDRVVGASRVCRRVT